MPWHGPRYPGEFPTLGYGVADWIERHLVVPGGPLIGAPFKLTDEQVRFLLWHYRLDPRTGRFAYRGSQLVRSQKWGKDPLAAAMCAAEGLCDQVLFSHWHPTTGEPVGKGWTSPWIQVAAVSDDQTANTFRPLYVMLTEGNLDDYPDLDVGETRVNLPGYGRIEPVTSSADSRLGQPITFAVFGEPQLWRERNGGHKLAANMRRGLAGMGGRWVEVSNAYDPSENSVAQRTHQAQARDVYLDWRPAPDPTVSLHNRGELRRALRFCYGDSHWVDLDRIIAEIQDPTTSPADARRFFLTLVTVGDRDFVNPLVWDAAAHPDEPLQPRTPVALGFDGSKSQDATALVACRIHDGRLFELRTWQRPDRAPTDWRVPGAEVDQVMQAAYDAYDVWYLYADPYLWQDYLDRWAARWPKRIVELPTNSETRIDAAISRFLVAFRAGQLTHDGSEVLGRHVKNAALARGNRKKPRDDDPDPSGESTYYLRLVKRRRTERIDAAVAAVLAYEARGRAIEDGALIEAPPDRPPRLW
jgi:hypothetical protein